MISQTPSALIAHRKFFLTITSENFKKKESLGFSTSNPFTLDYLDVRLTRLVICSYPYKIFPRYVHHDLQYSFAA